MHWTEEDINILKESVDELHLTYPEIAEILGRSVFSVQKKANLLNLSKRDAKIEKLLDILVK